MKYLAWDAAKNAKLKGERGISFEEVTYYLGVGEVLDVLVHPNQRQYPGQGIFVVRVADYAYLVPFVESEQELFLKTIIPSRKATKTYLATKESRHG